MKNVRLNQILELLKQQGSVSVTELSEIFGVTTKTIRRDLEILEAEGELLRTHGGAELLKTDILREKPFELRLNIESEKKDRIGRKAAELIQHGQKIFVGAGSSLYHMNAHIDNQKRLYVVTDSVTVVNQLNSRSEIGIFLIGGEITKHVLGTTGTIAEETLKDFWFDTAFISATTIDDGGRLFHRGPAEFGIYRQLAEHSGRLIALIDSTKLGKRDFINAATLQKGDILVTDDCASPTLVQSYEELGIQVILA
ncbi:DeoR/GlpR family DNA-binding transcription regulator [Eubacterium sp.]|uniref:DeoR/GlpR family DNA-binding transcription regulator n=1 Tax=Eubacterium sp. TaxID=142586 RepID=UPI002FC87C72